MVKYRKEFRTVIKELKQRMIAKSAKVQRYEQRIAQFRQNRLLHIDQKEFYSGWNGGRKFTIYQMQKRVRDFGMIYAGVLKGTWKTVANEECASCSSCYRCPGKCDERF